ncbi:unnamed protein product, partial [Rotaria magnacalcarata]
MSLRHRPLKIIETFDEQLSSLSSDELKTFVDHVRHRLDDIDEKKKVVPQEETN